MGRAGETGPPSDATLRLACPLAPHPDAGLRPNFESPQMRALYIVEMINWVRGPPEVRSKRETVRNPTKPELESEPQRKTETDSQDKRIYNE